MIATDKNATYLFLETYEIPIQKAYLQKEPWNQDN